MRLTFADAQRNVTEIANRQTYTKDVIFELLAAYGRSTSAITKLRSGSLNLAPDTDKEVLQRGVDYFKYISEGSLHSVIDSLDQDPLVVRFNPRYLIATDYDQLVAKDTKKDTTLDIKLRDIDRSVDFFYGWTGYEVISEKTEAVADRRAADKMKDLYAEIEVVNREKLADPKSTFRHDLNVFFSRLLFCFFAEDTNVFSREESAMFTGSVKDFTQIDGSDLDVFLNTLFDALDTEDRTGFTSPYSKFPYVNGTIFDTKKHNIAIPKFNAQARKLMIDCGNLDWSAINPDIFGSMFQSIVDEEHRANNGMHYTSVPNIMKTIEPLFIDELREEFDKNYDDPKKLNKLWDRISKIKVFDPACGSGNFLIIAYKELRKIEHGIIDRLFSDDYKRAMLSGRLESRIKLDNFYGIEIDDFAHEIAILSLYLAKHQMNIEFEEHFGKEIILIPLKDNAKIIEGNAARLEWQKVCPNVQHGTGKQIPDQQHLIEIEQDHEQKTLISNDDIQQKSWEEIYLIGNPPYQGARLQTLEQKRDFKHVFFNEDYSGNLDYIAIWFVKGAQYISGTQAQLAFVTTSSVSQGEHVGLMFPKIFRLNLEIGFAFTSFKWQNSAKDNAGVSVSIISIRNASKKQKYIYTDGIRLEARYINGYLSDSDKSIIVYKRSQPLSDIPEMTFGSMANDGGNLILSEEEYQKIILENEGAQLLIKKFMGADDYINNRSRYCLWIDETNYPIAAAIPEINKRIEDVREVRNRSKRKATNKLANKPYRFGEVRHLLTQSIIVPSVSSERRKYIPIGFLDENTVISNLANGVYGAELWLFAILNSQMHMLWIRTVCGYLGTSIRYTSTVGYNTFPVPNLSASEKELLTNAAKEVLFTRENHSEKTPAEMYDPDKMPEDLKAAHQELDLVVEKIYRNKPFKNDEERLADLFSLYEQMTAAEKERPK